jgi:AcrR family transcriptional regulator
MSPDSPVLTDDHPLRGLHPPRQERSRQALEAVLAAGADLLTEQGYEGFTIVAVAERAGVAVGTIYNRFDGKDALFRALHRRQVERLGEAFAAAYDSADWRGLAGPAVVERAIRQAIGIIERHSADMRPFMVRAAIDEEVARWASVGLHLASRQFTAVLLARSDEFRRGLVPREAADLCFRLVNDTVSRLVMFGPAFETDLELRWDGLADGLITACTAFLFPDDRSGGRS